MFNEENEVNRNTIFQENSIEPAIESLEKKQVKKHIEPYHFPPSMMLYPFLMEENKLTEEEDMEEYLLVDEPYEEESLNLKEPSEKEEIQKELNEENDSDESKMIDDSQKKNNIIREQRRMIDEQKQQLKELLELNETLLTQGKSKYERICSLISINGELEWKLFLKEKENEQLKEKLTKKKMEPQESKRSDSINESIFIEEGAEEEQKEEEEEKKEVEEKKEEEQKKEKNEEKKKETKSKLTRKEIKRLIKENGSMTTNQIIAQLRDDPRYSTESMIRKLLLGMEKKKELCSDHAKTQSHEKIYFINKI